MGAFIESARRVNDAQKGKFWKGAKRACAAPGAQFWGLFFAFAAIAVHSSRAALRRAGCTMD
jgi:hypothetical protein